MGFLDSVKKAASKTKLQGEITLIDREITNTKHKHGVLLYNVLAERYHLMLPDDQQQNNPALPVEGLEAAFTATMEDLQELDWKRREKDQEFDVVEAKSSSRVSGTTTRERARRAGQWISDTGASTKLKTQMAYYDREIRLRKEIFGLQVFAELVDIQSSHKFDEEDDGVGEALNLAKDEFSALMQRRRQKEQELQALS